MIADSLRAGARLAKSVWATRRVFGGGQHETLTDLHRIWGDRFTFLMGRRLATVLADPAEVREMFEQSQDVLSASESRRRLVGVLPPKSVPYQQGEAHARARKALAKAFAYASKEFRLRPLLDEMADGLRGDASLEQAVIDFCYRLAAEYVLGRADQELSDRLKAAVTDAAGKIHPMVLAFPVFRRLPGTAAQFRHLAQTRDELLRVIEEQLVDGEGGPAEGSLGYHLLRDGAENGMSREEIRDNLGMVAMATAFNLRIVLINALHTLAENPEWQEKIRDASDTNQQARSASPAALPRAVIKECLRVSPVVPLVSRMVKRDVVIGGKLYRAGQILFASPWLTHFRAAGWENPTEFDPTRFLNGAQHGYNYLPFGGGSNHCIGSGWSVDVTAGVVRRLVTEFRLIDTRKNDQANPFRYQVFNLVRKSFDVEVTC